MNHGWLIGGVVIDPVFAANSMRGRELSSVITLLTCWSNTEQRPADQPKPAGDADDVVRTVRAQARQHRSEDGNIPK